MSEALGILRVKVEVYIDVDLDAYESEYGDRIGVDVTKANIRDDLKRDTEDRVRDSYMHLSNIYNVRYENV